MVKVQKVPRYSSTELGSGSRYVNRHMLSEEIRFPTHKFGRRVGNIKGEQATDRPIYPCVSGCTKKACGGGLFQGVGVTGGWTVWINFASVAVASEEQGTPEEQRGVDAGEEMMVCLLLKSSQIYQRCSDFSCSCFLVLWIDLFCSSPALLLPSLLPPRSLPLSGIFSVPVYRTSRYAFLFQTCLC